MPSRSLRKVLLIQPPAFSNNGRTDMNPNLPLGIAYIAAVLEREGYGVTMLDAFIEGWNQETRITDEKILVGLPYPDIKKAIAAVAPDVVGITSMFTSQRKNAHAVAALAKEVNPKTFVVMGGAHPTAAPETVLADPNVDFVVMGEGDNTIGPLLECLADGGDLATIDGIVYRNANGQLVNQKKTRQVEDLDSLPFPARHLLPMEKYFAAGVRHGGYSQDKRATSVITSRGCQYYCNFCTAFMVFTRKPRMRSAANVIAELEELVNRYGVTEVFFEDDQFLAHQKRTEELLEEMARKFTLKFDTPNGISAWILNDRVLEKMKAAGCYRVNLAIESGNQDVLDKIINKPVKVDKIPGIAAMIRKHGMELGTFIVAGNIGHAGIETLEQVRDSFKLARRIRVRPHVSYLTPYPGSEVLEVARTNGFLAPDFDWDDLVITSQCIDTPEWTREELHRFVERERVKTHLWIWLTQPHRLIERVAQHIRRSPWVFVLSIGRTVREISRVVWSDENGRQRARPIAAMAPPAKAIEAKPVSFHHAAQASAPGKVIYPLSVASGDGQLSSEAATRPH